MRSRRRNWKPGDIVRWTWRKKNGTIWVHNFGVVRGRIGDSRAWPDLVEVRGEHYFPAAAEGVPPHSDGPWFIKPEMLRPASAKSLEAHRARVALMVVLHGARS